MMSISISLMSKNPLVTCFLLSISVLVTGCGAIKDALYEDYAAAELTSNLGTSGSPKSPYQKVVTSINSWNSSYIDLDCMKGVKVTAAECRSTRDYVGAVLVSASNEICVTHIKRTYGNEATYNIAFGTLTNIFAGGAAVIGAEATKSALGALAAFSNAERSLINESVYKTMLIHAITEKITQSRSAKLASIDSQLLTDNYSIPRLILDVLDYHDSCSFAHGLQLALKEGVGDTIDRKISDARDAMRVTQIDMESRLNELRSVSAYVTAAGSKLAINCGDVGATVAVCSSDLICKTQCGRYADLANKLKILETEKFEN